MFSRSGNPMLIFLQSYLVWVTSKIQVNFRFKGTSKVLMIVSYGFSQFLHNLCFRGQRIHYWYSDWATMSDWPRKSKSTSGLRGTGDSVLWIFEISHYSCFWGQGILCWYFYIATMFRWPRKSRKTSGPAHTCGYWWLCLVDFWNFFTIYVFEVRESFADIPTELPCLGDLKNSGHLPVQEVFEPTQTFVPWHKSSKFLSSRTKLARRLDDQRFIVNYIVM